MTASYRRAVTVDLGFRGRHRSHPSLLRSTATPTGRQTFAVTIGLYAGSFDPPHLGHLALVEQAARVCSTLYVVAAGNPDKLGSCLFDLEGRRALLDASTRHLRGVVAVAHGGLVADLAVDLGVQVLIRGMGKEMVAEFEMAAANRQLSGVPTLFLAPEPATRTIASRTIRADYLAGGAGAVIDLVPAAVAEALLARDAEERTVLPPGVPG
jgi:pantetheine-phosphate adenylyltransferase